MMNPESHVELVDQLCHQYQDLKDLTFLHTDKHLLMNLMGKQLYRERINLAADTHELGKFTLLLLQRQAWGEMEIHSLVFHPTMQQNLPIPYFLF